MMLYGRVHSTASREDPVCFQCLLEIGCGRLSRDRPLEWGGGTAIKLHQRSLCIISDIFDTFRPDGAGGGNLVLKVERHSRCFCGEFRQTLLLMRFVL